MNKKHIIFFLLMSSFLGAFAANEETSSKTLTSAIEILKLPNENRMAVLRAQGGKYYQDFITVAFNESQSMNLRWKALTAAAEVRGAEATTDLKKASNHYLWYMRNAALVTLSEVNAEEGERLAKKFLKDKALVVRSAAVEVLQKNLSAEGRDLLWNELDQEYNFKNSESLWIRQQIVSVLAKKPLDRELKIFIQLLSDKDPKIQLPAVHGLEKLTGVKLGQNGIKGSALVGLWKEYLKKEKIEL